MLRKIQYIVAEAANTTAELFPDADVAQRYENGWGTIAQKFCRRHSQHRSEPWKQAMEYGSID